jgi:hypothetical protein
MMLLDFALAIPAITLLMYVPLVCVMDWKHRRVDHDWWTGLVLINGPLYISLCTTGTYFIEAQVISFVAAAMAFAAMKFHYIEGADFMFILFIVWFLQYNPISGHWFMALPFFWFLVATLVITAYIIALRNLVNGNGLSFDYPRGIPLMLPISAALILTILLA